MKKILFFTVALCLVAGSAYAHDTAKRFGLGFNHTDTPIGGRYWFSSKVGLDFGFGFFSDDNQGESSTNWAVSAGLPINILNVGDRVNMHFLPWLSYYNIDNEPNADTYFDIVAALEFEVFVTKDLSVSAITGLQFEMYSPGDDNLDSETDIMSVGDNLTEFGVHYYLPGGGSQ